MTRKICVATVLAVAHRFVHGGAEFHAPVLLDEAVLGRLRGLTELAPFAFAQGKSPPLPPWWDSLTAARPTSDAAD